MSSKTNKTLNSAFGVPDSPEVITTSASVAASGLLYSSSVYRLEVDEDVAIQISGLNNGTAVHVGNAVVLYGGVPEIWSTPDDETGGSRLSDFPVRSVHVIVSGVSSAGTFHASRLTTRGWK
jgi:hypothetical protein